jgi:hypothetical protein
VLPAFGRLVGLWFVTPTPGEAVVAIAGARLCALPHHAGYCKPSDGRFEALLPPASRRAPVPVARPHGFFEFVHRASLAIVMTMLRRTSNPLIRHGHFPCRKTATKMLPFVGYN